MSVQFRRIALCAVLLTTFQVHSGPQVQWSHVPIFNQTPLEAKLGSFSNGNDPDALAVILWNDGNNNRLDAVRIPPPYNGAGVTSTFLENTSTLFALGDPCTVGNVVLVPYIKDFNVEVARYNGTTWSTSTIPGTVTNNFDNADCTATSDGVFIGSHDLTDGETEIFKSNNAGANYTFYGRYSSVGPFGGAVREPLASSFGGRYVVGLNQQSNGQVRATHFSTADAIPSFTHTAVENLTAPPGSFTFVKESSCAFNGHGITCTYNADGNARVAEINVNNGFSVSKRNLGAVNNNGSQFTFQGSTTFTTMDREGAPMQSYFAWGHFSITEAFTTTPPPEIDSNYPLAGVGGPVDACILTEAGQYTQQHDGIFVGPRVGSTGTNLFRRELATDVIFTDGFESGDTASWQMTCH